MNNFLNCFLIYRYKMKYQCLLNSQISFLKFLNFFSSLIGCRNNDHLHDLNVNKNLFFRVHLCQKDLVNLPVVVKLYIFHLSIDFLGFINLLSLRLSESIHNLSRRVTNFNCLLVDSAKYNRLHCNFCSWYKKWKNSSFFSTILFTFFKEH